jgi:hypothetical protein
LPVPFAFAVSRQPLVKNTVGARGGVTGHNVRYVLAMSLAGVVIAFAVLWFYFFR